MHSEKTITLPNTKSLVLSHAGLAAYIAAGRNKQATSRTLELNTYAEWRDNGDIAVRFYDTDVITYHADGSFTLNTGGWHTQTTAIRLDTYNPAGLRFGFQNRIMYVWDTNEIYEVRQRVAFFEGMHYVPCENGRYRLDNPPAVSLEQRTKDYKKTLYVRVKTYTQAITVARVREALADTSGDCWGCKMRDPKNPRNEALGVDHLWQHMQEEYYPGTLFLNAFHYKGLTPLALNMYMHQGDAERIQEIVTFYLRKQLIGHPELLDAERVEAAAQ